MREQIKQLEDLAGSLASIWSSQAGNYNEMTKEIIGRKEEIEKQAKLYEKHQVKDNLQLQCSVILACHQILFWSLNTHILEQFRQE